MNQSARFDLGGGGGLLLLNDWYACELSERYASMLLQHNIEHCEILQFISRCGCALNNRNRFHRNFNSHIQTSSVYEFVVEIVEN